MAKNTNYNEKQEQFLKDNYVPQSADLKSLIEGVNALKGDDDTVKNERSIRSKLSSLGIYEAPPKRGVGGASSERKIHIVRKLADALDVEFDEVESLEKANKGSLDIVLNAVLELQGEGAVQEGVA